ncbi:hypothetical protein [Vaginisenegalia massiliensis]|uniref:hypothetical protein n=1 Tax=Vaginisenegalia massiliensis TaxID=2058294 RepID=UPI000F51D5BB|nr:hypothetical protein [Vaginisenegalia massiliensis]
MINFSRWIRISLVWCGVLLVSFMPLYISVQESLLFYSPSENYLIIIGLFAYFAMLWAIVLACKPAWIEKWIALPNLYLVHGILSLLGLAFATLHKAFLGADGVTKFFGDTAWAILVGLALISLFFFMGRLFNYLPFLQPLRQLASQYVKRLWVLWLHRFNLLAVVLLFLHIVSMPAFSENGPFFIILLVYTGISLIYYGIYYLQFYHRLPKGNLSQVHLVDKGIYQLAIQAESRYLKNIKQGDFIFVRFPKSRVDALEYHPFSITNHPAADNEIRLTIKQAGDFTNSLDQLKVNQPVQFSKGYGHLHKVLTNQGLKDIVMIAGGIGITPFISLLSGIVEETHLDLLYSVKKEQNFLFPEALADWESRHPNWQLHLQKGRFSTEQLTALVPIDDQHLYLISGPSAMIRTQVAWLKDQGIKEEQIILEEFEW